MKTYISLFSGIGGFEVALEKKGYKCLGYSEIKPHALEVYKKHFPKHTNLGDITLIKKLPNCDLVVGGFPCTNLSSLACIKGGNLGLEGKSSGLFYELTRLLKDLSRRNKNLQIIIENNSSMTKKNRELITKELSDTMKKPVFMTNINSAELGVQNRKRLYWTTFPLTKERKCNQTWKDILDQKKEKISISQKYIDCLNRTIPSKTKVPFLILFDGEKFIKTVHGEFSKSRWQCSFHSDTTKEPLEEYFYPVGKSRPVTASFGNHNVLVDRTGNSLVVRLFSIEEIERLFGYPKGYTSMLKSRSKKIDCLGNTVVVYVIDYILSNLEP